MKVVFYEKPGCVNNTRQKALLAQAGHEVEARSLLDWPFTPPGLRAFFADLPLAAWFNASAPRLKSGEVRPEQLDEDGAIAAMLADRLLIRRPLIEAGGQLSAGFDETIQSRLGATTRADVETCPRNATEKCA